MLTGVLWNRNDYGAISGGVRDTGRLACQGGELQRAMELYQTILGQNPYREAAFVGLMRCYYRLGDRAAAIRQYQICAKICVRNWA
jgi:two-component SAPR family response regulator